MEELMEKIMEEKANEALPEVILMANRPDHEERSPNVFWDFEIDEESGTARRVS